MTPIFRISRGGKDVTANLNDRLLELDFVEHARGETDTLSIKLDDRDFAIELPSRGDEISLAIGYRESGLVEKGILHVSDVSGRGPPFEVEIHAKSASQRDDQKSQRADNHQKKSLKDIVETIAKRHKLTPKVGEGFDNVKWDMLNQTEESDWHTLHRLARDNDATFAVKNGALIFNQTASGKSAGGQSMQTITIQKTDLIAYTFSANDRPKHKEVQGHWFDKKTGKRVKEKATSKASSRDPDGATFFLRHLYPDSDKAKKAAESKLRELERGEGTVHVEIEGNANIVADGNVQIQTGRTGLDGQWNVKTVTHSISSEGFRTKIDAEAKDSVGTKGNAE